MDRLIKRFHAEIDFQDGEPGRGLMVCKDHGVAYQRDMSYRTKLSYYDAYNGYDSQDQQNLSRVLHAARRGMVNQYVGPEAGVLDVGVGNGEFIRTRNNTFGYDTDPKAVAWLKENKRWTDVFAPFDAFTFWDVIEHLEDPDHYFRQIHDDGYLFTSIPILPYGQELGARIREWKHYRPGEHLYHWNHHGFIEWMALYRFRMLECNDLESQAGRTDIRSYAFKRDLPSYGQTVQQYQEMHAKAYGTSAHLYFEQISSFILRNKSFASILDFGCGRSDMVAHFWRDGSRRIAKYDPAIPDYQDMPPGKFDLVLCTDVMEHIPMMDVDRVFEQIKSKSDNVIFTISLRPARAKLPDGRNAHVTLLSVEEWTSWVASVFGKAYRIPLQWDHILMLRTF